ncbi:17-beta-hydroxysteroid dehydrogenase type 3 isoform X1 [Anarrhichthys ocellatus]|uniref:17-beta-hydroxysteroid dehydrogenase type 3 isoform X1 n=1 Tax=Anarrhichthys ocellatus TaxID=433405 RepID=UPI0012EE8688|nr:testosterone 17-beta-dehydrogenase 3 isoform X1 [Anarrhichthys ocellatus]
MDLMELFFITLGAAVIVCYGVRLLYFSRMLFPKICFPLSKYFFTSMGEWAVVTGASEGIGRAYAFELAEQGMNVVIMSRTKETLDQVAKEIGATTGQRVKVIVTDLMKDVFSEIEEQLRGLNIGVLVNNVGILPSVIPCKFLECAELDQTITKVINCNVKTMAKMCKIILPGMENRGKGVIVNISSGVASIPFPLYTLYAASKVFVERFSQGLQAEYKDKGILIQAVAPFGVSTRMADYQKTNIVTLSPGDFVKSSLQYLRAGDKTYGSVCHIVLGWLLKSIPLKILYADSILLGLQDYVKKRALEKGRNNQEPNISHSKSN